MAPQPSWPPAVGGRVIHLSVIRISATNQVLQSEIQEATDKLERLFVECGVTEITLKMADGSVGFVQQWKGV